MKVGADIAAAAMDPFRPLLAQIVVTKRCNLSCGYCYEHDQVSSPIPFEVLRGRIDEFKRLKVVFVTLNGGEPLLHPQAVDLVRYIHDSGMIPMMNSNGFLLQPKLIRALNAAKLYGLQISCDGMEDNEATQKSMRRLRGKLELLAEHATFRVRVNTVLGSGSPEEAIEVARIVLDFGFDAQCSLIRDASGSVLPLDQVTQEAYGTIRKMRGRLPIYLNDNFQLLLAGGEEVSWKCRSGARYFHVDAQGLVHLCQPRAGTPAIRLEDYTREDIKRCFYMQKRCSKRCPHAYAHIGSRLDGFRHQLE